MKKSYIFIIIALFLIPVISFFKDYNTFEILGCKDSANIYVDLNKNYQIDENELLQVSDLIPITTSTKSMPNYYLSTSEKFYLEYKFKNWAKINLLHRKAKIIKTNNGIYIIEFDNIDYRRLALKNGFAQTTSPDLASDIPILKIKNELNKLKTENYTVLNIYNNKYHKLDCPIVKKLHGFIIIPFNRIPKGAVPCKICHHKYSKHFKKKHKTHYAKQYYPASFQVNKSLIVYFINFNNTKHPYNNCAIPACRTLLNEINNSKSSIDFAIYGINNEPLIFNALVNAQNRGVKIRWVSDFDSDNDKQYPDTEKLSKILKDYNNDKNIKPNSIMHNKFFIFDNKNVWTGSANITDTDLSNFNANYVLFIKSSKIASIYKNEFNQLYNGYFHKKKQKNIETNTMYLNNSTKILFSPQDRIITNTIIPYINNSRQYIYMPIFYLTHKNLAQALINAHKRGVDIRIITDATNARGKYSIHKTLRENDIKVKTENKAGKMHMKAIIIDGKYSIIGSMNFTKSGEYYNDENVVIIENKPLCNFLKGSFLFMWNEIPDKYLSKDPAAESFSSIGSCTDGIDNDFDGKIDKADLGCNLPIKRK